MREIDTSAVTIGRWAISERESQSSITVNDAAGRALARVPRRPDDLDIARLIAVAPQLLEALEEIIGLAAAHVVRLERTNASTEYGEGVPPAQRSIAKARAALAKARHA